jgi:hypothetical protein
MTSLRSEWKLHRLNRRLIRRNVPLRERRSIVHDVRVNLTDAAGDLGERTALQRLGDTDELAAAYTSPSQRHRPRVRNGIVAAAWTFAALVTVTLGRIPTFGTIEVFDRHTGATTWHVQLWRLGEFSGDATQDTLFEATIYSYGYLLGLAIAFGLGARLWLLRHPQSKERMVPTNNDASEI